MPTNLDILAALPTSTPAVRSLLRQLLTKRMAYVLDPSEDARNITAQDPSYGIVPLAMAQNGKLFAYDSTDSTTAHDGLTCLVSADGKRFKTNDIAQPWSALDKDLSTPPGSPALGDQYIVGAAPSGAWSGKAGQVAIYTANGWKFAVIPVGRHIFVQDEASFYYRDAGGDWQRGVGALPFTANSIAPSAIISGAGRWIVENQTTNAPPGTASVGTAYIIGASPTGAWAGQAGKIALCEVANTFAIYAPRTGELAYDKALGKEVRYSGSAWSAGADALVLIQTQIAAASANIDFTSGLDDSYDAYELAISSLKAATNDVEVWLRVATAGPTWRSGASDYAWGSRMIKPGGAGDAAAASDSKIVLTRSAANNDLGAAAGKNFNARIRFNNPEQSDFMSIFFDVAYVEANDNFPYRGSGSGVLLSAAAIAGVRILLESGNIASGRFSLYGLRKS